MPTFTAGNIRFEFTRDYRLVDADKEANVSKVKRCLQHTKDVNFFGMYQNDTVFMMEVKNFRGYPLESIDVLTEEIAQKLRDTIAIITGASRNTTHETDFWEALHKLAGNKHKQIKVVFWLEEDITGNPRHAGRMSTLTQNLKKKCGWLTSKISVQNIKSNHLEGVSARFDEAS